MKNQDGGRASLARRIGVFGATMIVMGGIVGAGIFINPYVVAMEVHTPALILGAWIAGGLIALAGGFIYAELASRLPAVGGQYAYLREAYHPALAFLYGWSLLLVIQTGGMAAVAVTFGKYAADLAHSSLSPTLVATVALAVLTVINCLGVRAGSSVQSALMVLKIGVVGALVAAGAWLAPKADFRWTPALDRPASFPLVVAFGAAMVPVLFAYGGYQTANFIAGEVRDPRKDLPRGLILGVMGVVALYVSVNWICLEALGPAELALTATPASAVMRQALGRSGANWIAAGIALSALGFLSQSVLTAPRVYFAMARDGVFFRQVAWLSPATRVPLVAIALQGVWAMVIAVSGRYEQILNYVVAMDELFIGLSATCLFVFRRRERKTVELEAARGGPSCEAVGNHGGSSHVYRTPGHPFTTAAFVAACWMVVAATVYRHPHDSLLGLAITLAGLPVYYAWRRAHRGRQPPASE